VKGEWAEVFFVGDDWGETINLGLSELPYYAVTEILAYLIKRRGL
jgi:hypothetical protein